MDPAGAGNRVEAGRADQGATTGFPDVIFVVVGSATSGGPGGMTPVASIPVGGTGSNLVWTPQTLSGETGSLTVTGSEANGHMHGHVTGEIAFSPVTGQDTFGAHIAVQVYVRGTEKCYAMQCTTAGSISVSHPEGCEPTGGPFGMASWNGQSVGVLNSCVPDQTVSVVDDACSETGTSCCTSVTFPEAPGVEYSLATTKTYDGAITQQTVAGLTRQVPIRVALDVEFSMSVGLRACNCLPGNRPPQLVAGAISCGSALQIPIGQPVTFGVQGIDPDSTDSVSLSASGVPAGAVVSPTLPALGNPVTCPITWTPTLADTGGHDVVFHATDGCAAEQTCTMRLVVVSNRPPDCSGVRAQVVTSDPPAHQMQRVQLVGATDPDGNPVTLEITGITQDEPVTSAEPADHCPDAVLDGGSVAHVRWERSALGNGRAYRIAYTATDGKGAACTGSLLVCVPLDPRVQPPCTFDGDGYNSLGSCTGGLLASAAVPSVVALRLVEAASGSRRLQYDLPVDGPVHLDVFDVLGRRIALLEDSEKPAGVHEIVWDTSRLPGGVYYLRLQAGGQTVRRSAVVLR